MNILQIQKSERYVAVRILYSLHYIDTEDFVYLFEEIRSEDISFDENLVINLINLFKEKNEEITKDINALIKGNDLESFIIIPADIIKLAFIELTILKSQKNICIADYLHVAKILGVSKGQIGFINALLDQINIEF